MSCTGYRAQYTVSSEHRQLTSEDSENQGEQTHEGNKEDCDQNQGDTWECDVAWEEK